jgi:hypothetical protein
MATAFGHVLRSHAYAEPWACHPPCVCIAPLSAPKPVCHESRSASSTRPSSLKSPRETSLEVQRSTPDCKRENPAAIRSGRLFSVGVVADKVFKEVGDSNGSPSNAGLIQFRLPGLPCCTAARVFTHDSPVRQLPLKREEVIGGALAPIRALPPRCCGAAKCPQVSAEPTRPYIQSISSFTSSSSVVSSRKRRSNSSVDLF